MSSSIVPTAIQWCARTWKQSLACLLVAAACLSWWMTTNQEPRPVALDSRKEAAAKMTKPIDKALVQADVKQAEAARCAGIEDWMKDWQAGRAELSQGLELARQQKQWMQDTIRTNPVLAYQHAMDQDSWSKLPAQLQKEVAHRFSGPGTYQRTQDCETETVWHQLTMENFSTGKAIIAPELADRHSFQGVIKGVTLEDLTAVAVMEGVGGTPAAPAAAEPAPVTGVFKVLWLNVKFADEASWPTTDSAASSSLSSVASGYNTYSYGQLTLNYEVLSVAISANKADSPSDSTIISQAQAAATAAGKVLSNYKTILYRQTLYGQYAGLSNSPGYVMLSKVAVDTTTHEIAHTMGVHHANWWKSNTGQPAWGAGVNTLYGEDWDAMALDAPRGDFNVPEKVQLGWLAPTADYVHDVGSGVYRIYDYRNRTRNFNTSGVTGAHYSVSIYKDSEATNGEFGPRRYMLSFRDVTNVGTTQVTPGLRLHWPRWTYNGSSGYAVNGPYGSTIIDTHPTTNSYNDAPLAVGETYVDNDAGNYNGDIFITPLTKTDPDGIPQNGDEYLDVKVVVGDQVGNNPPVAGNLSFSKSVVGPGEAAVMTVTASDPDNDTLAYFWDFGLGTTVTARQSMKTNGAPTQSFTYTTAGTYTVKVTVSDCRGGTVQLSKTITVSNTPPVVNAGVDQSLTLATGSAWTPADIQTLAWYDAADAATVAQASNAVSSWNDKSGNNRNVLQATATKKPTYNATGWNGTQPALTFDGGDALTSATISNVAAGERTVFIVYDSIATPTLATQYLLDFKGTAEQYFYAVSASVPKLFYKGSANSTAITTGVTGKHVVAFGNDARTRIYKDGTIGVDDAVNQTSNNSITQINVGSRGGSEYFQGAIAEVIVVPYTMSDLERQVVEGYLAHKWALTDNLPATHPYKSTVPGAQRVTANISGSISDVNVGQPLSFKWSAVSGPAPFTIRNPLSLVGNAVFTAPGTYTLRLTGSDTYSTSTDDVVINVSPSSTGNSAPTWVANPFSAAAASEGAAYSASIAGSATDIDAGAVLAYAKVNGPAWLSVAANGVLSGTPGNGDVGSNSFTVSVSDGIAPAVQATLNITVDNVNNPPSWTANPISTANASEDAAYSASLVGGAVDLDADAVLSYSKVSGPAWLNVAANGTLSGTPGNGDVGSNSFTVSVSDGIAAAVQATLNITVLNTNDAPVWLSSPMVGAGATADAAYAGSLAGTATDVDAGAALVYAKVSGPAWLNVATTGAISGTPGTSDVGANNFTVSVSDGIAAAVQATLSITVSSAANNPPVVNAGTDQTVVASGGAAWTPGITCLPITGDTDCGISSSKVYTHAVDFGADTTRALVNGVQFQAGGSTFGAIAGTSATVGTGSTTITAAHAGNTNSNGQLNGTAACGMEGLVKDMNYNNTAGTVTLTGLTSGVHYQFRLYQRAWGTAAAVRTQTIGFDTDGVGTDITTAETTGSFNEDDARSPSPSFATFNQVYAYTFDYTLPAGVTTLKVYINRVGTTGTYHLYGLTNEQVSASGATVNLDGTVSDPDGTTPATTWSMVSGPASVSFGNANAVDTTATFSVAGVYVLRLTANDGTNQAIDEVTVTVEPAGSPAFGDLADGSAAANPEPTDVSVSSKKRGNESPAGHPSKHGNDGLNPADSGRNLHRGQGAGFVSAYLVWANHHARTLNPYPQLDINGDGWLTGEEFAWGMNLIDPASYEIWATYRARISSIFDPAMDTDGDGLSNGDEFRRGSDPTDGL